MIISVPILFALKLLYRNCFGMAFIMILNSASISLFDLFLAPFPSYNILGSRRRIFHLLMDRCLFSSIFNRFVSFYDSKCSTHLLLLQLPCMLLFCLDSMKQSYFFVSFLSNILLYLKYLDTYISFFCVLYPNTFFLILFTINKITLFCFS